MKHPHVRRTMVALTCTSALVASLTACGGSGAKASLPSYTGGSGPTSTVLPQGDDQERTGYGATI